MVRIFLVVGLLAALAACDDPQVARKALGSAGFSEVETTGFKAWMCGRDDSFSTGFVAKNPQGHTVTGAVCSSWGKGATIRFD